MSNPYKLKDDIVHFIVGEKRKDPGISCRKLVNILSQNYQITLSKSSINAILKEFNLSSPVGRRGLFPNGPAEKTIFFQEHKKIKRKKPLGRPKVLKKHEAIVREKKTGASEMSKLTGVDIPVAVSLPEKILSPGDNSSRGILYDGMGCIFLKAVEWELSDKPILGKLFREHSKERGLTDMNTAAEILLLLEPFGIKRLEDLSKYNKQGLWAINGLNERVEPQSLSHIIRDIQDVKGLHLRLSVEIPHIFKELNFIKLTIEDGTEVWIDTQLTSVWAQNVQLPIMSTIHSIMSVIAAQFLNNVQPVIFCSIFSESQSSGSFSSLLSAFENISGKRIVTITVYDTLYQEIACFKDIPSKKRTFIAGLWPWHSEFQQLYKENAIKKEGQIDWQGRRLYYTEKQVYCAKKESIPNVFLSLEKTEESSSGADLCEEIQLRVMFLREAFGKEPFVAILTNASNDRPSTQDVILSYLLRWPNLQLGFNLFVVRSQAAKTQEENTQGAISREQGAQRFKKNESSATIYDGLWGVNETLAGHQKMLECGLKLAALGEDITSYIPESYDIHEVTRAFFLLLNKYCLKIFFPDLYGKTDISSMISYGYELPGYLSVNDSAITVNLVISDRNHPFLKDLEFAVLRINESNICDFQGRKLRVGIAT